MVNTSKVSSAINVHAKKAIARLNTRKKKSFINIMIPQRGRLRKDWEWNILRALEVVRCS